MRNLTYVEEEEAGSGFFFEIGGIFVDEEQSVQALEVQGNSADEEKRGKE